MLEVASLTATGEVKIPLKVRTKLALHAAQRFRVEIEGPEVRLVPLGPPSEEQVRQFVAWTRSHPRRAPQRLPASTTQRRGKAKARTRGASKRARA